MKIALKIYFITVKKGIKELYQVSERFLRRLVIANEPQIERAFILLNMPQLLPFYFVNQLTFAFLVLLTLIYVFSKYILPMFTELFLTRMYITKL
jgi:F-type H+-transporting ATPase subunit 8